MVNKRAWIKLLEAFMAISLIVVILSITIYGVNKKNNDIAMQIQEKEFEALNILQNNDSLREEILNVSTIPIESNESDFPNNLNVFWNNTITHSIECLLKICYLNSSCESLNIPNKKDIYVESVVISATKNKYYPLQLKAFCWEK